MAFSPDDVANVAFRKTPFGERGYNKSEVDSFLAQLEQALRHPGEPNLVTAQRVSTIVFRASELGRRGYDTREVDDFLDQAVEALGGMPAPAPQAPSAPAPTRPSTDTGERHRTGFFSSLFRRPSEI